MISDRLKTVVEGQMKNVEVVSHKRSFYRENESFADQVSASTDQLKEKYLSLDSDDRTKPLKRKFLGDSDFSSDFNNRDSDANNASNDDVEVGLIRNKNVDDAADAPTGERTIIVSKNDGTMLGSQG